MTNSSAHPLDKVIIQHVFTENRISYVWVFSLPPKLNGLAIVMHGIQPLKMQGV